MDAIFLNVLGLFGLLGGRPVASSAAAARDLFDKNIRYTYRTELRGPRDLIGHRGEGGRIAMRMHRSVFVTGRTSRRNGRRITI